MKLQTPFFIPKIEGYKYVSYIVLIKNITGKFLMYYLILEIDIQSHLRYLL